MKISQDLFEDCSDSSKRWCAEKCKTYDNEAECNYHICQLYFRASDHPLRQFPDISQTLVNCEQCAMIGTPYEIHPGCPMPEPSDNHSHELVEICPFFPPTVPSEGYVEVIA